MPFSYRDTSALWPWRWFISQKLSLHLRAAPGAVKKVIVVDIRSFDVFLLCNCKINQFSDKKQ